MTLGARALFGSGSLRVIHSSGRVLAQRSGLKGPVDDQVVVLRLHEEDRIRRARYPAGGWGMFERDDAKIVNSLAILLWGSTGLLALSSRPHVRDHLVEEACRFEDGGLRSDEYTPATEHEHEGLRQGRRWGRSSVRKARACDAFASYWERKLF